MVPGVPALECRANEGFDQHSTANAGNVTLQLDSNSADSPTPGLRLPYSVLLGVSQCRGAAGPIRCKHDTCYPSFRIVPQKSRFRKLSGMLVFRSESGIDGGKSVLIRVR